MSTPVRALVEGAPQETVSTPAQTSIGTVAAVVLVRNPKRKGFIIQNTGTTVIRLTMGSTSPTQTVYHVSLKACTGADDGSGGVYIDENYVGTVNAISSGASGTFVITEFMTGTPNWDLAAAPFVAGQF